MKKILSLTLVICLLLSSCILLASCSKVNEKKMEEDPVTVLSSAVENATSKFFTDEAKIGPTVGKAMKDGSLEISLEAEMLKELEIGKITETLYMSQKDKKLVSDTQIRYKGEDLGARIFFDEKGIVVNGNSILGSDLSYGLFPSTLAQKFAGSKLAESMGMTDEEALVQVNEVLNAVADTYQKMFTMKEEDSTEMANKLLDALEMTISEQELTNENGKAIKCIVASYAFNNETYKNLMKMMIEEMEIPEEELPVSMDELLADMTESLEIDLTISMFINKKKGDFEKLSITGTYSEESMESPAEIDAFLTISEKAIRLNASVGADEEITTVTAELTKEETDDGVSYVLLAKAKMAGTTVTLADLTFDYVKDGGAFTITVKIPELIEEDVILQGKIASAKNTATISIHSVKYDNVEVELALDLTFRSDAKLPAAPENVKDVVDLTEEEIQKFMEDFQNSKLGKLIFGAPQTLPA